MRKLLITGGTGTVGMAFCKYVIENSLFDSITILSRNEKSQVLAKRSLNSNMVNFIIGDIRDKDAVKKAMIGCTHVLHTAALKHIDLIEDNYEEALKTNILGSQNIIDISNELSYNGNTIKTIYISTDKACNPNSMYGSTKLTAEKMFSCSSTDRHPNASIRFGNILGSNGSIFECWNNNRNKQIVITDNRIERYIIGIEIVVSFIRFCFDNMVGGEVFIPKMNNLKVLDIAKLFSNNIIENGLRSGEKMIERLYSEEESYRTLERDQYYLIKPNIERFKYFSYNETGSNDFTNKYIQIKDIAKFFNL
jgi:UDP-N-acetylglucosamine 4,6-dehydratase